MASLVVDASVAASWFFPDEKSDCTNAVLLAVSGPDEGVTPQLWAYEIRNSILIGCRRAGSRKRTRRNSS